MGFEVISSLKNNLNVRKLFPIGKVSRIWLGWWGVSWFSPIISFKPPIRILFYIFTNLGCSGRKNLETVQNMEDAILIKRRELPLVKSLLIYNPL